MLKLGSERTELRVVADQIGPPRRRAGSRGDDRDPRAGGRSPENSCAKRGGTFHLPCAGETNWHGFAEEIFRLGHAAGLPLRVEHLLPITTADYPTPARRPQNSRLDGRLAEQGYGIRLPESRGTRGRIPVDCCCFARRLRRTGHRGHRAHRDVHACCVRDAPAFCLAPSSVRRRTHPTFTLTTLSNL